MKRYLALATLFLSAIAFAGQVCTIDPPRPAPGSGFYVIGSKLYDPTGEPFVIRGVNRVHWDQTGAVTGVPLASANAERLVIDFTKAPAANLAVVQKVIDAGVVPIIGNWAATGKNDAASLSAVVSTWEAQASTWTAIDRFSIVNIANEEGAPALTNTPMNDGHGTWKLIPNGKWKAGYLDAITRMRAAKYSGTLMIDAGNSGQDAQTVIIDGPALLAADPLHNLLFDVHVYGAFYRPATASWQQDYATAFAALKASGLPIVIGEFGPGRNVGPSPTLVPPEQVIADAEAAGFGWLAWAWDDNNLAGCQSNDSWFSMTVNCGKYTGQDATELTAFGRTIMPLLKMSARHANFK